MYKVIKPIAWEHDIQEDAGHVTHAMSAYEPGREVALTDWPDGLVAFLVEVGAVDVIADEPPKPAEVAPKKARSK